MEKTSVQHKLQNFCFRRPKWAKRQIAAKEPGGGWFLAATAAEEIFEN